MGLNVFVNGTNSHTRRVPMSVSSGLKRSHRVSQCHETLGAEHIRAPHKVSQCREALGAEHRPPILGSVARSWTLFEAAVRVVLPR